MTLSDVKRMVLQGENLRLEFKRKATYPEKIVREMIAFANTQGGWLLIGVDDDKSILGLKYPEEEIFVIEQHIQKYAPTLVYQYLRIPLNEKKEILVYKIPESTQKPEYLIDSKDTTLRQTFVRVADMSITASKEMETILKFSKDKRDVKFRYGQREEKLIQYLNQNPRITLSETRTLLDVPRKVASYTLVTLVRAGLLKILPTEHGDFFMIEENAFE